MVGQLLGEDPREAERRKRRRQGEGLVVLRHRYAGELGPGAEVELVEPFDRESAHDLPHPVAAVVEEQGAVAVPHGRHRRAVAIVHQRPDELVGLAPLVGALHREHRMLHRRSRAVHHGVVGQPGPVPSPVAVHPEVAPGERRDVHPGAGEAPHVEQERADDLGAQRRRRVAAVEEAMDGDGGHPGPDAELDTGQQVPVERVDAARAEQPHQVQGAAALPEAGAELDEGGELVELAALNALRDSHEVLRHHPSGAQVQVPDLAVAHLSFRQSHREAASVQQRSGVGVPEPVPDRGRGQLNRVTLALGAVAPAVQDDQDDPVPGGAV